MFGGVNKVFILGTLGYDPDVRYMQNGKAVASIRVFTKSTWKDKNSGKFNSKFEWHKVVLYNQFGEMATTRLKKGFQVYVEGSLKTNKWQDKDGIIRYITEIIATNIQVLDFKDNESYNEKRESVEDNLEVKSNNIHAKNMFDDDIPF